MLATVPSNLGSVSIIYTFRIVIYRETYVDYVSLSIYIYMYIYVYIIQKMRQRGKPAKYGLVGLYHVTKGKCILLEAPRAQNNARDIPMEQEY